MVFFFCVCFFFVFQDFFSIDIFMSFPLPNDKMEGIIMELLAVTNSNSYGNHIETDILGNHSGQVVGSLCPL